MAGPGNGERSKRRSLACMKIIIIIILIIIKVQQAHLQEPKRLALNLRSNPDFSCKKENRYFKKFDVKIISQRQQCIFFS